MLPTAPLPPKRGTTPYGSTRPTARSAGGLGSLGLLNPTWNGPGLVRSRSVNKLNSLEGSNGRSSSATSLVSDSQRDRRRAHALKCERPWGGLFYQPTVVGTSKFATAAAPWCTPGHPGYDPVHASRIKLVREATRRRRAEAAVRGEVSRSRKNVLHEKKEESKRSGMGVAMLAKMKRRLALQACREHAMAVLLSDEEGDGSLALDEFDALIRRRLPFLSFTDKTLEGWHSALDVGGGGTIALVRAKPTPHR